MGLVDYSDSEEEEENVAPSGRLETTTSPSITTSNPGTGVTLVNKTDDRLAFFGLFGDEPVGGKDDRNDTPSELVATHTVHSVDYDCRSNDESQTTTQTMMSGSDSATCCCICGSVELKYRCPACHMRSCSLECCKKHKQEFNCNGIRNRIPFLKVSEFTDKHLVNDYLVLQGITDEIERKIRNRKAMPPVKRRSLEKVRDT